MSGHMAFLLFTPTHSKKYEDVCNKCTDGPPHNTHKYIVVLINQLHMHRLPKPG